LILQKVGASPPHATASRIAVTRRLEPRQIIRRIHLHYRSVNEPCTRVGGGGVLRKYTGAQQKSRRTETVETAGVIRPLGIAEINRATGEGLGGQRNPHGVGKVCAGFHNNDQTAGAGDIEPKPVRPHTKAGTTGLGLRIPQLGPTPAKSRAPTHGTRHIADGRTIS